MKTEIRLERFHEYLRGEGRALAAVEPLRVERVMTQDFVSVPSWFPADKAASVLRHTGKAFALVAGPRGDNHLASLNDLLTAPSTKSVGWCAKPLGPTVANDTTFDEAMELMDAHSLDRVAVVFGRLLVGIVTRDPDERRVPANRTSH